MLVRTAGATANIRTAMSAPVSAAVAQTFALALVSAPIIWPAAYITPAITIISIAMTGRREVSAMHISVAAAFRLASIELAADTIVLAISRTARIFQFILIPPLKPVLIEGHSL